MTGLFEEKINSFITKGIPALLIEEGMLILYFDEVFESLKFFHNIFLFYFYLIDI